MHAKKQHHGGFAMKLGIPIYEGVNLLDVAGPLEMFYWAGQNSDLKSTLISPDGGAVTSINRVRFEAQASFAQTPALDILWVPGGEPGALQTIMKDPQSPYLQYLRKIAANAKWVCSVCEGALLLARAGLLDDALVLHRMSTEFPPHQGGYHPPALCGLQQCIRQSVDRRWHLRRPR
jgi:putative intracellular protease/amidase